MHWNTIYLILGICLDMVLFVLQYEHDDNNNMWALPVRKRKANGGKTRKKAVPAGPVRGHKDREETNSSVFNV